MDRPNQDQIALSSQCAKYFLLMVDEEQLEEKDTAFSTFLEESFHHWYKRTRCDLPDVPLPLSFGTAFEGGWSTRFVKNSEAPGALSIKILQPFVFLKTFSENDHRERFVYFDKPGFVNVCLLGVDLADSQSLRELAVMDAKTGEWYLSPKLAVELFAYHVKTARKQTLYCHLSDPQKFLETVITEIYENDEDDDSQESFNFDSWEEDPAILTKIETLPCIECEGWPDNASEWPRNTAWPDSEVASLVKKAGFHLVRSGVNIREFPLSWRLSFVRAENLLMKTWNEGQRKCYLALRLFCSVKLGPKTGLGTHVLKTCMLWDSEEYPPADDIWTSNPGVCMARLLMRVRRIVETGRCNHYFLTDVNVFRNISDSTRAVVLEAFDEALESVDQKESILQSDGIQRVAALADCYVDKAEKLSSARPQVDSSEKGDILVEEETASSIFTDHLINSTYETYVRVNMTTSKQDKERATRSRAKFFQVLVTLYVAVLAVNYGLTSSSTHATLMVFLTFLVSGLLLNLGWSYRWSLCFIYSMVSHEPEWSLTWKVIHFVLAFPVAKFIAQMMGMFERPLERQKLPKGTEGMRTPPLAGTPVAKPGLVAPMLFLYGVNLLLLCSSRSRGLWNLWDVFVCTLANHAHFMVFWPWLELFYSDYNQLLVRLKPTIGATVCTSLFVMFMLHCSEYDKSFWPWLCMTLLTIGVCWFVCSILPTHLSITISCIFAIMLLLPARILYSVMVILYVAYWASLPWQSSPVSRALRSLTVLCVHLCLQTTSLTAILGSVNMVFGCCMYIGCLHSVYTAGANNLNTSTLQRISSKIMVVVFVGGVALLTLQSKPVSTQEAFIMVSAPVAAAILFHSLEGTVLQSLMKLWKRAWARDGGAANHT